MKGELEKIGGRMLGTPHDQPNGYASMDDMPRCSCCPYGCHIDREFLCLTQRTPMRNIELDELRRKHQMKMRHRQTMESLLMQSALPSSDFSKQPEVELEVTRNHKEQTTIKEGSETNNILSELDETIAEAMRSIDELMNSKRKTKGLDQNTRGEIKSEVLASTRITTKGQLLCDSENSEMVGEYDVRCGFDFSKDLAEMLAESFGGTRLGPGQNLDSCTRTSQTLEKMREVTRTDSQMAKEVKISSKSQLNSGFDSMSSRELQCHNEQTSAMKLSINSTSDNSLAVYQANDLGIGLSSSSDLAKALAILLPSAADDETNAVCSNSEALVRLRQYLMSSLRHMRSLEQQVKSIPVMQVRISVLKEEKKLLRLQLLSLQNGLSSSKMTSGVDSSSSSFSSNSTQSNQFVSTSTAHTGDDNRIEAASYQMRKDITESKTHRIVVKWSDDASRSSDGQRCERTTALETGFARQQKQQLQRTTSLFAAKNRLQEEQRGALTSPVRDPEDRDKFSGTVVRSLSTGTQFDSANKRLFFNLGTGDASSNLHQYSRRLLNRCLSSETGKIAYRTLNGGAQIPPEIVLDKSIWNVRPFDRRVGQISSPDGETCQALMPRTFNEPMKIRKVNLANDGHVPVAPVCRQSRNSFNVGIQCELLTSKPVSSGSTCCQCRCVENQRKCGFKDTDSGRRRVLQTPDVIVTHCHKDVTSSKDSEPRLQSQVAPTALSDLEISGTKASMDASTLTEDAELRHIGCQADDSWNRKLCQDVSCMTDQSFFTRDRLKDVGCFTDAFLNRKPARDAFCMTEETILKRITMINVASMTDGVSIVDTGVNTDKDLIAFDTHHDSQHLTVENSQTHSIDDASCTSRNIFLINAATVLPINKCSSDKEVLRSEEVDCLRYDNRKRTSTKEASCSTDESLLTPESREVGCSTDSSYIRDFSRDVSCFTESTDLMVESREIGCMTEDVLVKPLNTTNFNHGVNDNASGRKSFDKFDTTEHEASINLRRSQPRTVTHDAGCNTDISLVTNETKLSFGPLEINRSEGLIRSTTSSINEPIKEINNNGIVDVQSVGERQKTIEREAGTAHISLENQLSAAATAAATTTTTTATEALLSFSSKEDKDVAEDSFDKKGHPRLELSLNRHTKDHNDSDSERGNNIEMPHGELEVTHSRSTVNNASNDITADVGKQFKMNEKLVSSCKTYSIWLHDSTEISSKQLNECLAVIQLEWFTLSGQKTSSAARVKLFLEELSKISLDLRKFVVNMVDSNENTALHYAVPNRNFPLIDHLLSTGACDVNRRNRAGCTAVMLASLVTMETEEHRDTLRRLIEMSDVNMKSTLTGQTALMLAAGRNHSDTVRLLLESKANPNLQDLDGSTALMCASEHGYIAVVKILLSHPICDPCISDSEGSTALSVAMEAGHRDIGVLLYAHINFRQNSSFATKRHERRGSAPSIRKL